MAENEEKQGSELRKIWHHPSFWKIATSIVVALTGLYVGIAEKWFDNKQLQEKQAQEVKIKEHEVIRRNLALEDSIRRSVRNSGAVQGALQLLQFKASTCKCKYPIERVSLVRWSKGNPYAEDNFENYDKLSLLYEIANDPENVMIDQFNERDIDYGLKFLKPFLAELVNNQQFYIYRSYRPNLYDSVRYGNSFRDWYYTRYSAEAHIVNYLGETSDLKEHWFLSAWIDSTAYESSQRYKIVNAIYASSNDITELLRLRK